MDLGAYGGEARSPNIDRLARQGAMFTGYRLQHGFKNLHLNIFRQNLRQQFIN
ncbi:MAG: hypothetical protein ACOYKF_12520 [Phenylobacterium sp.]